ncbi:hypothetical protein NE865_02318 [Phthorimaea operculella]|nr:hypothetical protein NE865_02318 [Phthorimaea operculella]
MHRFLAVMDASKDVRYIDGYREGFEPPVEEASVEEEEERIPTPETDSEDEYWRAPRHELHNILLLGDRIPKTPKLSSMHQLPIVGEVERSASTQKIIDKERDEYMKDWSVKPRQDEEVDKQLRQLSAELMGSLDEIKEVVVAKSVVETKSVVQTKSVSAVSSTIKSKAVISTTDAKTADIVEEEELTEQDKIRRFVESCYEDREERRENLLVTFDELAVLVDKCQTASYDLGMVAGRQMSITSGEFIVQTIEKEILEFIDEQIAVLPDPDLKKKKAKPDEVAMIREMLDQWLNENMEVIIPEVEEVEEEEEPIPEITLVYAVPGIGPPVDDDTIQDVIDYAMDVSKVQAELFMPRNIRHFMCPPLEKFAESSYDDDSTNNKNKSKKEEVTSGGGIITD